MFEAVRTLPVTRKEAFAVLLDIARWEDWLPFRVRDHDARFKEPGDRVTVQYRSFRIPLNATATLEEVAVDESLRLTIRVPGSVPLAISIDLIGTGTKGVVIKVEADFNVPGGHLARAVWARSLVPLVVRREIDSALDRLHSLLAEPLLDG